jgi:hypothetical protein
MFAFKNSRAAPRIPGTMSVPVVGVVIRSNFTRMSAFFFLNRHVDCFRGLVDIVVEHQITLPRW